MSSEACQTVLPYWKATLEFKLKALINQDGNDSFDVFAEDSGGGLWGWMFWGDWSYDWYTLVFNLRQWYGIGDLGANYCNTLYLGFESDSISNAGFGARVDDLYVWFGDTVGSYECEVLADPESGPSPLTVSFRASTDLYGASYYWWFGDGATSEQMDPVHVYTSPGTYNADLTAYDDYGTSCVSSQTIVVTQGTCTYSISPTSANYGASGGNGSFSVLYPNCWDLSVGSHVNFGKSYEQTAVRELKEELGLDVTEEDLLLKGEVLVRLPKTGEYFNVFEYNLKPGETTSPSHEEINETRWISIGDIKKSMEDQSLDWYTRPVQVISALY